MKKYKFIEQIPEVGYIFSPGDEIAVRKGAEMPFRWELHKVAADYGIYPMSITEDEWTRLNQLDQETVDVLVQLDQDLVDKLTISFTNQEIEDLVNEGVLQSTSGLVIIDGLALPTPAASTAFAMVGQGVYTKAGQANVIVPANHIGVLLWNGTIWRIGAIQEVPNNVDQKIEAQKNIPGGIAGLDENGNIDPEQINAYTKEEINAWRITNTTALGTKVDKVVGKGLSTNDYLNVDKQKVNRILTDGPGRSYLADDGTYKPLEGGGGTGSGFLNITTKTPLSPGEYYDLESAIATLDLLDHPLEFRLGTIITFEEAQGKWIEYRFIGDPNQFLNTANWTEYTVKDMIKGVIFNGDTLTPNSAGQVSINVNTTVETTLDPTSDNPIASSAVAAEFAGLSSKYGTALSLSNIGTEDEPAYTIALLDEEGEVLSTTDPFTGGGGGGGNTATARVVLTKQSENPTIKAGDKVVLQFYYDHQDIQSGASTGIGGKATISVLSGATTHTEVREIVADTYNTIDVSDLVQVGANTVRVKVEVDNGESIQVSSISWRVQVVTLRLTSAFDFATLYTRGQNIVLPFNLNGSGTKALKLYVDGVMKEERTITTSSSNGSFTIPTTTLTHGSHSIQLVAELAISDSVLLQSNSIYFDVAVREIGHIEPIVATRFDYNNGTIIGPGERPYVDTVQFNEFTVSYAGYNPVTGQNIIDVLVDNTKIATVTTSFEQRFAKHRILQDGTYAGQIKIGTTTYTFGVRIAKADVDLSEPTDNLIFKLSALGRSNNDSEKTIWTDRGVTTTFTNVQWAGDGWTGNTLRLANNGRATINYKPLDVANATFKLNAWAYNVKFKITNAVNADEVLISCMSNGTGFEITAEEARMFTQGNSEVNMKFASGQDYNITFVSIPVKSETSSEYEILNDSMLYLYINGILSGGIQRGAGDNIYQGNPANIVLQATNATLDVYGMRFYNNYLTAEQALSIFMIDLNTIDQILDKFKFNNIIDDEGDVTVESLPVGSRYVIFTGAQANGMTTAEYAAAINNKETRYDIDEVLHIIKGEDRSLNFLQVGGCIRLQGTSSLAYPVKNYRLYYRSAADSKVFAQVYTGCDAQGVGGTLIPGSKPKWSFKKANPITGKVPAPVNVWCLKADFAESSSSHNTGMARLVNDVLVTAGDPTPAQKHVASTYPWDVRTTIDGEPCFLFVRKSRTDKPRFLGKYNFNNDKSTEDVFGFLDIPGYHLTADKSGPSQWVIDKFAGENPTECWEFLNNDYPLGQYLNADFTSKEANGKPSWGLVFENRFPDNQDDYDDGTIAEPVQLKRWVTWVNSTQNNKAKFKAELKDYADVEHLCSYFVFTQLMGAVDQMVKNAMLGFWYDPDVDKVLAYYIFYDNDTILGVRNDGRLKYSWDLDRQTLDPEKTASAGGTPKYAYEGHESVLWNNLESEFKDEIEAAYKRLRNRMTNDFIFNIFDRDQVGKFPERIYNLDAQYKYVKPKTLGVTVIENGVERPATTYSYLESMQGSRASHRRWWLENRLDLFDARHSAGQFTITDITWKGISDPGAKVSLTMGRPYYVEFRRESTPVDREYVPAGGAWSYTYEFAANIGTIFHLYGGKYFRTLDLSEWGGFTDLSFPTLVNLEKLVLGRAGKQYTLSALVIGNKMPMLKEIDVTNYTQLPSLDLSGAVKLEKVIAKGATGMGTIALPKGSPVNDLTLPPNLSTLRLEGLPYLTNAGIKFPDGNNVSNLVVDGVPNINWEALVTSLGKVQNIRVTNINMEGPVTFLDKYKNMNGIDANGNIVPGARLIGTYQLTTYIEDSLYLQYRELFPELLIKQAEYSVVRVYEKDPTTQAEVLTTKNLYNPDNNTGYGTPNAYVPSGHFLKVMSQYHRYLGKQVVRGTMTLCQLHDKNSEKFADNVDHTVATEALLEGQQGDVWIKSPKYWYKGVNDYLKGVVYIAYSSQEDKPSSPPASVTKRVTKANLISSSSISANRYIRRGFPSITDALNTNNSPFSVIRLDVAGWKKVNFTMATYGTSSSIQDICSMFTTEPGINISEIRLADTKYTTGGDYIMDVPANAKYLYITIYTDYVTQNDFEFFLSNSTNPLDWNPDWHLSEEFLASPWETSWSNAKLRSIKTWVGVPAMSEVNLRNNLANRNFTMWNYDEDKNLKNLIYLKTGDTDSLRVFGTIPDVNMSNSGMHTKFGMQDTTTNGFDGRARFKLSESIGGFDYEDAWRVHMLGFENLTDGVPNQRVQVLDSMKLGQNANINGQGIFKAIPTDQYKNGFYIGSANWPWMKRLVWGTRLDRLPMGSESGGDLIHYTDSFAVVNGGEVYIARGAGDQQEHGYFAQMYSSWSEANKAYGRLMFKGNIIINNNVAQFKTLIEAV